MAAGDSTITLAWEAVAGATSYTVYLATESGVSRANYASKADGERRTAMTSPAVLPGLARTRDFYYFAVTATNAGIESRESIEVTARPSPVAISITGPTSLQVHESGLLTAAMTDFLGHAIALTEPVTWTTSDPSIATVSERGVVTGAGRGTATIGAKSGAEEATVDVNVHYRVMISPSQSWSPLYQGPNLPGWVLGIGDTLLLSAHFVDIDGVAIGPAPQVQWISSNPQSASVRADGLVTGLQPASPVVVTAITSDGSDSVLVSVLDVIAGRSAMIRFVHAVSGLGPVTFIPSHGPPVTLSFGQSVERPLLSGSLSLETQGLPDDQYGGPYYRTIVREGDHVSFYAGGLPNAAWLSIGWAQLGRTVPPGSVRIRFAYAGGTPIAYLLDPEASPLGRIPEVCYLDPGDVSSYFTRKAGEFDIFLEPKYGAGASESRQRVNGPSGRSMTAVLTADEHRPLIMFQDP